MTRTVTLTVRLDEKTKQDLEKLAVLFDIPLSELIRGYIIPFAKAALEMEAFEAMRDLEKVVVRAIISSNEFQGFLEKLAKYLREEEFCGGVDCEYKYNFKILPDTMLTIVEKKVYGRTLLWPGFVEKYVEDMSTHYELREVESLKDLAYWLEDLEYAWNKVLHDKIEEVREAIRRLLL